MSHYAVAVFHRENQDIDDLLAPYDENLKVAPYVRYTKQEAIDYVRGHNYEIQDKSDDECWKMLAEEYDNNTDADGNIYTTYNPDSKWDWYEVGGRFRDFLKLRNGEITDSAPIKELDFSSDKDVYQRALRFWDIIVDHKPLEEGEKKPFNLYKEDYYREYYGNRETYARYRSQFSTYAVVTPDGKWHGKGEMGWWGCSSETADEAKDWEEHYKERFIDAADPDWYITIVDCHI